MSKDMDFIPALKYTWLTRLYDPLMELSGAAKKLNEAILSQINMKDGDIVLDFGCGSAILATEVKKRFKSIVYGVDIDPDIIEVAKDKVERSGHKIFLDLYDGKTLPYEDEMFDKVLSSLVFHHLAYDIKLIVLGEIYRVLKPGGELYILDFGKPRNIIMRGLFLPIQLFDGFDSTSDNVKGMLPEIMEKVGFDKVAECSQMMTPFGDISVYRAVK